MPAGRAPPHAIGNGGPIAGTGRVGGREKTTFTNSYWPRPPPSIRPARRAPAAGGSAGSRGAALHDAVAALPLERIVEKDLPSALASAALPDWLRENGIKTLTLAGYMTQNCVESTARQAAHDGYQVEILADATGALAYRNAQGFASAQTIHQTSLIVMQSRFAAVLSTQDWIAGLKTGAAPLRETIFQSAIAGRAEV